MSHVIGKERCPVCATSGRDRKGDNLAIYSDGHQWCFSCGYYVSGDAFTSIRPVQVHKTTDFSLPDDVELALGGTGWQWLQKYKVLPEEVAKNRILWSESLLWLIFPYFEGDTITAWQARNFNPSKSYKYFTRGDVNTLLWILHKNNKQIVLVEDIVSAIKVSRVCDAMPILGSVISLYKLGKLRRYYDNLIIWLDPDKQKEMIKFSQQAQMYGFKVKTLWTEKDPKDYSTEEITQWLT